MESLTVMKIDGSVLEGGGQIVRNSVALSALLSVPLAISKIRARRSTPGLKAQHVAGIELVSKICDARIEGCQKGGSDLSFHPQKLVQAGAYSADPGTAGSTTLLLQIALPPLIYARADGLKQSHLKLKGGTNAASAPQIDYTSTIFLPFLQRHFGIESSLSIKRRGFWPKGGGEVNITITPTCKAIDAVTLTDRGHVVAVKGRAFVAGLPGHLANKMSRAAVECLIADSAEDLTEEMIDITSLRESPASAQGSGSGIFLWATTDTGCVIGGSALGSKSKDMEAVGVEAAEELSRNLRHGGCVDDYLQSAYAQDQIIIFIALAQGESKIVTGPLTCHTKTAMFVAEQLTGAKFNIVGHSGDQTAATLITCRGIGLRPQGTSV